MIRPTLTTIVVGILAAISMPAKATPVLWTFSDVVFDDGGTLTGTFVYDYVASAASAINVQSTAGTAFGGGGYTEGISIVTGALVLNTEQLPPSTDFMGPTSPDDAGESFLSPIMVFLAIRGTFDLGRITEGVCPLKEPCVEGTFSVLRTTVSGNLVASPVPLPATMPLLGAGMGALLAWRWRRASKQGVLRLREGS